MKPLSLRLRASLLVSVVLVVAITTISTVAYIEFEKSHFHEIDLKLLGTANEIVASLKGRDGQGDLNEAVHRAVGGLGHDASISYRIWMDGSSTDLVASGLSDGEHGRWLRGLAARAGPMPGRPLLANVGSPGDEHRAVWLRQEIEDGVVNIAVTSSSRVIWRELREFRILLPILGASLVVTSAVAVVLSIRWGLRPIRVTAERLDRITHPNAGTALFDDVEVPEELRPFAAALMDMLGRLDKVLQQQKQFTSDAAHELRTPLAVAKSTLQATQMHQRQVDEYKSAIEDALKDVTRMERLTEELLVLARLDETHELAEMREVRLDSLLADLVEVYDEKVRVSGGGVVLEEGPAASVRGDSDELIRLFCNILDNAVRYGPPGGTIRVGLKREPDNCATVCVHDAGGGIPPDDLPNLFDRFYRADHSRSSSTGGVGLGLAIAKEIARRHRGDISITSNSTSGTTVSVRLPLA